MSTKRLDEAERIETQDWVGDIKRREYKLSKEYLEKKKLAEKFLAKAKKRKKS